MRKLIAAAALVALGFAPSLRADDQVPFKGSFDLLVLAVTQLDPTHLRFDAEAHVLATHLGKAQGPGFFVLDLMTLDYFGEATWVAANGDAVFLAFVGQFIPTATPGLFDSVATFEIVDGTGRFAGASGGASVGGQFDAITSSAPAPLPFVGTVSSPGSLKN
jgi:hypothetical protein